MSDKIRKVIVFILLLFIFFLFFFLIRYVLNTKKVSSKDNLVCVMTFNESSVITYKTVFKNEKVEKITITYLDENINQGKEYASFKNQIDYLCGLKGSTFKYASNDLIITINKDVLLKNKNDVVLKNMFKKYHSLKMYYEKLGYDCE